MVTVINVSMSRLLGIISAASVKQWYTSVRKDNN